MSIRHKVIINFYLDDGCSQEKGEVNTCWTPINFSIYSDLFLGMINDAIEEWLSDNTMQEHTNYEVIFAHVVEHDGGGAVTGEYFEPIHQESQSE